MQRFIGAWRFKTQSFLISQTDGQSCSLEIVFTHQPIEVKRKEITEYRTGYAFPAPFKGTLIDPQKHHGAYEWIQYSTNKRSVRCGTDYFGLGRLYYAVTSEQLLFSNDLFLLCEKSKHYNLNLLGCAMLLGFGECLGRHTIVDGIFRLGHGEVLEFDEHDYQVKTEWLLSPPGFTTPPAQFIAESNNLLLTSVNNTKEWTGGHTCLLSGGDDSRRIAAGIDIAGIDVDFVSQRYIGPGGWDEDTIPAQMIAEILDKPLTILDVSSSTELEKDIYKTLLETNAESMLHGWLQKTLRHAASNSLVYDGLAGGELMNGHYIKAYPECAEKFYDSELLTNTVLKKFQLKFRSPIYNSLRMAVQEEFNKIPETPYRMTLFHIYNHTRRGTGSVSAMMREHGLIPYMPFTTKDMAIHSLSLDHREHFNNYYQGLATYDLNQKLAYIPRTRLGFSNDYKVNLSHLNLSATESGLLVGKTNLALIARLLSVKDSLYMTLSEIMGLHSKHIWRSIPLRRLGLIANVVSSLGSKNNRDETTLKIKRSH